MGAVRRGLFGGFHAHQLLIVEGKIIVRVPSFLAHAGRGWFNPAKLVDGRRYRYLDAGWAQWTDERGLEAGDYQGA